VRGVAVEPGPAGGGLEEEHLAQPADLGAGGAHGLVLQGDALGAVPVVVVPVHQQVAAGELHAAVALEAEGDAGIQAHIAQARVGGQQVAHRVVAVVEDQQLAGRVALAQEAGDRPRHKGAPVGGGHQAGDERGHGRIVSPGERFSVNQLRNVAVTALSAGQTGTNS
jgi:hypothetical protein